MSILRFVIAIILIGTFAQSSPKPKVRKSQAGCDTVINEVSYGSTEGSFVEKAKLCTPGKKANEKVKLGGFFLLVLDSNTLELLFIRNLHRMSLSILPYDSTEDDGNKVRHSKHSAPTYRRTQGKKRGAHRDEPAEVKRKKSRTSEVTSTSPAVQFDYATLPCELRFDCSPPRSKRFVANDNNSSYKLNRRLRRDLSQFQKNVRGLYVSTLTPSLVQSRPYAFILLKLPKVYAEVTAGRPNFVVGATLSEAAVDDIKSHLHDFVLINPAKLLLDQSKIIEIVPDKSPVTFIETNPDQPVLSVSKCDTVIAPLDPEGFVVTQFPTPLERNVCKQYRIQPYRFHGKNFNVQAKRLIANTVVGLQEVKNDPAWQKLTEQVAAPLLLDVHQRVLWMQKVLQQLRRKSVIVYDNSPVHTVSTAPALSKPEPVRLEWLTEKHTHQTLGWELIPQNFQTRTVVELREIVKSIKEAYHIDELIRESGHEVIRLPPYQADLNPIEYVWSDVRRATKERNVNLNARETSVIAKEVFAKYTAQQWAKHIEHVKKTEKKYAEGDAAYRQLMAQNPDIKDDFVEVEIHADDDKEEHVAGTSNR